MATTDRRFEQLQFPGAGARQPLTAAADRMKLILVVAGFAALVAWGILDESDRRQPERAAQTSEHQPVYDGHGKWGGYMSQ